VFMLAIIGRSLLFCAVFFFYFWTASTEYGLFQGLHLTGLAFSFFILCSPVASYLYLMGCLPGAFAKRPSFAGTFGLWFFLIFINLCTIYWAPGIYNKSPFYKAIYSVLLTYPVNLLTLGFSGGTLLYHWLVTRLQNHLYLWKRLLHLLGVSVSAGASYLILSQMHTKLVFYLLDMSNANF